MTLRKTINFKVLRGNKVRTPEQVTDEILELFEKMIDEKQNIKNLKPASKPEDVIYNSGIFDGLQELKEELKK